MGQLIMQVLDEMMWWEDHSYDIDLLIYSNPRFFYLIRMSLTKDNMPGHTAVSTQQHFLFRFSISPQFSLESLKIFQYLTAFPTLVAHDLSKAKCAHFLVAVDWFKIGMWPMPTQLDWLSESQ